MPSLMIGVNDLLTVDPKLAEEWSYGKNRGLKPNEIAAGSQKKYGGYVIRDTSGNPRPTIDDMVMVVRIVQGDFRLLVRRTLKQFIQRLQKNGITKKTEPLHPKM